MTGRDESAMFPHYLVVPNVLSKAKIPDLPPVAYMRSLECSIGHTVQWPELTSTTIARANAEYLHFDQSGQHYGARALYIWLVIEQCQKASGERLLPSGFVSAPLL